MGLILVSWTQGDVNKKNTKKQQLVQIGIKMVHG